MWAILTWVLSQPMMHLIVKKRAAFHMKFYFDTSGYLKVKPSTEYLIIKIGAQASKSKFKKSSLPLHSI